MKFKNYLVPDEGDNTLSESEESTWREYESKLKKHDWYYDFSDDFRVWSTGERERDELERLREKLMKIDSKRATKLWKKYHKIPKQTLMRT